MDGAVILLSWNMKGVLAVLGCSLAISWPGALTFGFPGVMTPIWQKMFHVGNAATGCDDILYARCGGRFYVLFRLMARALRHQKNDLLGAVLTAFASVVAAYAR